MLSSTGNTGFALIPGIHINCEECYTSFRRIRISPVADPGFHVNIEPTIQEGVPVLYPVKLKKFWCTGARPKFCVNPSYRNKIIISI